jgi:hypothetical protein
MVRYALVCAALVGCTSEIVVSPVIEGPVEDPDASAFPNLDEIIITVAHAGADRDLVSASFTRGEDVNIAGAPFGDDLVVHMSGFRGAGSVAYGRTCPFAVDAGGAAVEPHLFFSRSVTFGNLGVTPADRSGGRAIPYLGAALVLGGGVSTIERFDPLTGMLTSVGAIDERTDAVEALIGSTPPRVVIVGGQVGAVGASFLELVEPNRNVERVDDLQSPMPRIGLTATSLTDGRVIVIGGNPPGGPPVGTISELALGTGVEVRTLPISLAHPRSGHTATRLGDDLGAPVLITGGTDPTGAPVAIAELFKPLTKELAKPATFAPQMVIPRTQHQAVRMPDNSILIIGGLDASMPALPLRALELFTLDGGFRAVGNLPENAGVLDMSVTTLPDGRILIAGGRTQPGGPPVNTAFIARLDPLDGTIDVVPTDRLAVPRANHQAALLCDGTIFVTGGAPGRPVAERYNPSPTGRR